MHKNSYLIILLFCCFSSLKAQHVTLSPQTEISTITIGSGNYLYDSFGHNAFRVHDKKQHIDVIYNYGSFDFDTPNFYLKFAQGKLPYKIQRGNFDDFLNLYIQENRWVKEQLLNITYVEKQKLFNYLENNLKPENKYYNYDFFYDNCATKIRDVIEDAIDRKVIFNESHIIKKSTFRQLIQQNLNWNSWGSLGIDIALGSVIDVDATPREHMFLPNYIYLAFENATLNDSQPLVTSTKNLYQPTKNKQKLSITSPVIMFGTIGLFIFTITYLDIKKQKRSKWLDATIFLITGIIGVILVLLWFATNHSATAYNYNLLWAFALNSIMIVQILKTKPKKWFINYMKFLLVALGLLVIHWITGVQTFAFGLIPILLALAMRYIFILHYYKKLNT